jgi:hypothetical protein
MKNDAVNEKKLFTDKDFLQEWDRVSLWAFSKWSWNLVWHEWYAWKFFVIYLIIFWVSIIAWILDSILTAISWMSSDASVNIFSEIVSILFSIWVLWFSFNIAKWLIQKVKDVFHEITFERFWKILFITIVIWIIIWLCSIPLIISLLQESWVIVVLLILWIILILFWTFLVIRLKFAQYAVIDKWFGPKEALIYSRNITKWHFWEIILFDLYFVAINILGMLCLLIGLIWTTAMISLATSKYYLILSELYENWLKWK